MVNAPLILKTDRLFGVLAPNGKTIKWRAAIFVHAQLSKVFHQKLGSCSELARNDKAIKSSAVFYTLDRQTFYLTSEKIRYQGEENDRKVSSHPPPAKYKSNSDTKGNVSSTSNRSFLIKFYSQLNRVSASEEI